MMMVGLDKERCEKKTRDVGGGGISGMFCHYQFKKSTLTGLFGCGRDKMTTNSNE